MAIVLPDVVPGCNDFTRPPSLSALSYPGCFLFLPLLLPHHRYLPFSFIQSQAIYFQFLLLDIGYSWRLLLRLLQFSILTTPTTPLFHLPISAAVLFGLSLSKHLPFCRIPVASFDIHPSSVYFCVVCCPTTIEISPLSFCSSVISCCLLATVFDLAVALP